MPEPQPELSPQLQQQLATLQALNQQYQVAAQQRAQFEAMKLEAEQALEALSALPDDAPVYRSVGTLLVKEPSKKAAQERLQDEAETMGVRLARLQKQEAQFKGELGNLQAKLQAALQGKPGKV